MADTIIRLKVESQEYEGKIKRAVQGLQQLEKHVRDMGASFEVAEKADLEFVRALGQMETKATSSTGKLAELKSAFIELSVQYKNLSDAEKKGKFGVALNQSLVQLKGRIDDLGSQIKEANTDINGIGGILESVAGKIGVPVELFTKMGVAVAAAGAAIKVATDAFNVNESLVDEWWKTVEAASSVYEGFLTSLNTGDFGGFLSRMGDIISAARNAYDELDRLGTMRTIQSPEMSAQRAENERNRAMLQTRRYIAPLDGSAGIPGMENGELLSDTQVKQIEKNLQDGISRITTLIENEVKQTTDAIDAEYLKQAQTLGMSVEEFRKGTSSMAEFDKMIDLAQKYDDFENAHTKTIQSINLRGGVSYVTQRDNAVNPYEAYKNWDVFRADGDAFNNLVKLISERDALISQAYSSQAQSYRTINRVEGITARVGSGGNGGADLDAQQELQKRINELVKEALTADEDRKEAIRAEIAGLQMQVEEYEKIRDYVLGIKKEESTPVIVPNNLSAFEKLQQSIRIKLGDQNFAIDNASLTNLLSVAIQNEIDSLNPDFENLQYKMAEGLDIPDSAWQELTDKINEQLANLGLDPIVLDVTTGGVKNDKNDTNIVDTAKKTEKAWSAAADAVSTIGGALQQIEDPSAKVAGIVLEAIASIALGFSKSTIAAAGGGPIAWIAATVSGLATMVGTISAIKNATKGYADGGMVGGNSYSGDNIVARLNSGEGVLTANGVRNAQTMAANANTWGNLQLEALISGESLRLVLANNASRRGGNRSQYAITKFG